MQKRKIIKANVKEGREIHVSLTKTDVIRLLLGDKLFVSPYPGTYIYLRPTSPGYNW